MEREQAAAGGDYQRVVGRLRGIRARYGRPRPPRPSDAPALSVARRVARGVLPALWSVCLLLPWGLGLSLHAAATSITTPCAVAAAPTPAMPPVLRNALLQAVTLAPRFHLGTSVGTAEVSVWSPDGRYLAVGYSGGGLVLWDLARHRLATAVWRAHGRFLNALAWSPDGRLLASAAPDGWARLWRVGSRGTLTLVWSQRLPVRPPYVPAVAFAPAGDRLAVADGARSVTLWRLTSNAGGVTPRLTRRLRITGHTTALAWSPDGRCLAVGSLDGHVVMWPSLEGEPALTRQVGSPVYALAWAPRGDLLAAGGADGAVRLLDGATLRPRALLLAPFQRTPVLHIADFGQQAPASGASQARPAMGAAINGLGWSPSGNVLAVTATGVPLRLWQPARGTVVGAYRDNWDLNTVAWRDDGRALAVAADDGAVRVLRVADPAPLVMQGMCRLAGGAWCHSLLGRGSKAATGLAPSGFMSR